MHLKDNFNLIPWFFSKKIEIFIPLEAYTYVVTACSVFLATFNSFTKKYAFFFPFLFIEVDF